MPTQHIIHFTADDLQLTGTLHLPDGAPHPPFVIGCHGLLANRNSPKQIALADALNRLGIAYFRFDHRGCGDSQGRFDPGSLLETRCSDLYHAIQTIESHPRTGRLASLFGSSFGGTVILATAAQTPIPRLATWAAPITSSAIRKQTIQEIQTTNALSTRQTVTYTFDITPQLPKISHILVMHGDRDEIVPLSHAEQIYQNAQHPKEIRIHQGSDHRMTNPTHQKDFLTQCVQWFTQ